MSRHHIGYRQRKFYYPMAMWEVEKGVVQWVCILHCIFHIPHPLQSTAQSHTPSTTVSSSSSASYLNVTLTVRIKRCGQAQPIQKVQNSSQFMHRILPRHKSRRVTAKYRQEGSNPYIILLFKELVHKFHKIWHPKHPVIQNIKYYQGSSNEQQIHGGPFSSHNLAHQESRRSTQL